LVGSRAICRLADILKMNSRAIDTAARYGGDEFVLVLADAPEREAMLVAQRIQEIMLNDAEDPKISASIGVAVYRGDNSKIEKLLSAADQDLYAGKSGEKKRSMARTAG
jgi:diguanylate cyclase (GGDEF)-like protein